jgi:hypothetical protein
MIRPPQITSRFFVLMGGNYSVTEAPEQSTRPSCLSGLCRFNLVKRFAALPASGKKTMAWCCVSVTHALLTSVKFGRFWEIDIWMCI